MQVTDDPTPKGPINEQDLKKQLIQQFNQKEVAKSGFPTEIIDLPSKGLLYPEGHPLASGKIEMKYMCAKEEDILTSQNLIKQGVVLDKLFQSMIVTPVNYDDILIGDKNAIMIAARVLGYGKKYDIEIKCPGCSTPNKVSIDLTLVKDKVIDDTLLSKQNHSQEFEFVLPQTKRVIRFKLLTVGLSKQIEIELKGMKKVKSSEVSSELTTRMKHIITAVDGNADIQYIRNFVENEFFAFDARALRKYLSDIHPDVDLSFNFECTECSHSKEGMPIILDVNFFWPGN